MAIGGLQSRTCDCGNPKEKGREACPRCTYMDGEKPRRAALIQVMRLLGGEATLAALCVELPWHQRKISEEIALAIRDGQIERIETQEEAHKNVPTLYLVESIPARVLVGEQTTLPRLSRFLEPRDVAPRPPKPPAKPRPPGWAQAVMALTIMRQRRPPKPHEICDVVVDEVEGRRCCEIIWHSRRQEHLAERHGADPPAPPKVPDVLPGQLAWC